MEAASNGAMWVVLVMLVLSVLLAGGASARHMVINQSGSPFSVERVSVNGANNNDSAVVVAAHSTVELPVAFAGAGLVVRNQLTGGVFGPFKLRRNAAMLVQSTGLLTNLVTVLLGTVIQGALTALTTLIAAL